MQDNTSQASQIIHDADALIAKVQGDLDTAANFYRDNNIDPDKILSACEPYVGLKEVAEIERLAIADKEAIEKEVQEGMARLNFAASAQSSAAGVRKSRNMI